MAVLLLSVFCEDVLVCPCGGRRVVLAFITECCQRSCTRTAASTKSDPPPSARRMRRPLLKDLGCLAVLAAPVAVLVRNAGRTGFSCAAFVNIWDVRLINYFLEWSYTFLRGAVPPGASIWSPPFFYPEPNVLAYSDTMFSALPFYIPARWLGASPATALFWFVIAQYALTPVISYLCARRVGLGPLGSFVFACCFGWSWARHHEIPHLQFACGWIIPLFFLCVFEFAREGRWRWLAGATWVLAFAWYMAVYVAYFLLLVGGLVALFAVRWNADLKAKARDLAAQISAARALLFAAAVLLPVGAIAVGAYHYRLASAVVGGKDLVEALMYQGTIWSWLRPDGSNLLWGRFAPLIPNDAVGAQERQLFLGWIAFLCAGVLTLRAGGAAVHGRLTPKLLLASGLLLLAAIVLVSHFPPSLAALNGIYRLAFKLLPGFGALRASGRIVLVLSAFSSLLGAVATEKVWRRQRALGLLLGAALVAEALPSLPPVADRCEPDIPWKALQEPLCAKARAHDAATLFFVPVELISLSRIFDQVPEMSLALRCGLNTVNGYTGRLAPLMVPLHQADPSRFACAPAHTVLDAAMRASGKGVLIYIEREGPLGTPAYSTDSVARCFQSCLAAREPICVTGRCGEVLALTPVASCTVR